MHAMCKYVLSRVFLGLRPDAVVLSSNAKTQLALVRWRIRVIVSRASIGNAAISAPAVVGLFLAVSLLATACQAVSPPPHPAATSVPPPLLPETNVTYLPG